MLRIAYFGTATFAVAPLAALLARPDWQVVAVVSQPDKPAGRKGELASGPVATFAREHGLPLLQPAKVRDEATQQQLRDLGADLFIVAAYGKILPQAVLDMPRLGCLNLHGSILPRHRGASPIQQAILEGDESTGVSLMRMDAEMDHGPVYVVRARTIAADDTHATLEEKLAREAAGLLTDHLQEIADGAMQPVEQKHELATLTKLIDKEDGRVRWGEEDAWRVARKLRAYTPWPGIFAEWTRGDKTTRLKLLAATPLPDDAESLTLAPGTALQRNCLLCVKTVSGMVLVKELQPEGKTAMSAGAFLAGNKDILGAVLK